MVDAVEEQDVVKMAGIIGKYFGLDPIDILNGSYFEFAVRLAAFNQAVKAEEEANKGT